MIRERILFRLFFSLLLLLSFSPFCTYEPTSQIHPNNLPPKRERAGKRPSVLKRLHEKQAAIAARSGKPAPQVGPEQEAERNRK